MKYAILLLICTFVISCKSTSQVFELTNYWQDINIKTKDLLLPEQYRAMRLDMERLRIALDKKEQVTIPLPDGTNIDVTLKTSTVMSEELAQKYPEIKSYEIENTKGVMGRIDVNTAGFFAMVTTSEYTFFVNPIAKKEVEYISYEKKYATKDDNNPFIDQVIKK